MTLGAAALLLGSVTVGGPGAIAPRALAADGCTEPNDSADRACELKQGQVISDELDTSKDEDRLSLDVKDGQTVEVTVKSMAPIGGIKMRLEDADGNAIASIGLGPGERQVLAERLPAGKYFVDLTGEGGDPGRSFPYTISWKGTDSDGPLPIASPRGSLRDLVLGPVDVGQQALQTGGRLLATDVGRTYEAIYERENTQQARKYGPMYLLNRVYVAESVDKAQAVFDAWAVSDRMPEANDARPYESLGDQPMPPLGDIAYATGACFKCTDDNPLRSYRIVTRFDTVVYVLYAWGRDAGSNFDVVMFLANKLQKHLGQRQGPFPEPLLGGGAAGLFPGVQTIMSVI